MKKLMESAKALCVALGRPQLAFERGHSNTAQRPDNYIEGAREATALASGTGVAGAALRRTSSSAALGFTFVTVTNLATQQSVSLPLPDMEDAVEELKDTLSNVNAAMDEGDSFLVPEDCDPEMLFFQRPICIGVGSASWKSVALGIETSVRIALVFRNVRAGAALRTCAKALTPPPPLPPSLRHRPPPLSPPHPRLL